MSVWKQLDIAPTNEARAIKRAYAKKLKTIRPDENPQEFQGLREARDEALWLARFDESAFDDSTQSGFVAEQEESTLSPAPAPQSNKGATRATRVSPAESEQEVVEDINAMEADSPPYMPAREGGEEVSANPAEPVEPALDESEAIVQEFEKQFGPWNSPWDYEVWWNLLSRAAKLEIWQRQNIQYDILQKVGKAVEDSLLNETSIEEKQRRNAVLMLLDEEFGWSRDDRMVYEALDYQQADQLSDMIRRILQANSPHHGHVAGNSTFPILSLLDLNAYFFNKKNSPFVLYYTESLQQMKWKKPSWHWPSFLFSYMWTAWHGMAEKSFWLLFMTVAGFLSLALGKNFNSHLLFMAGMASFSVSHILAGLNAKRWVMEKAAAAIHEVDEKSIVEEKARIAALTAKGKKRAWLLVLLVLGLSIAGKALIRLI